MYSCLFILKFHSIFYNLLFKPHFQDVGKYHDSSVFHHAIFLLLGIFPNILNLQVKLLKIYLYHKALLHIFGIYCIYLVFL